MPCFQSVFHELQSPALFQFVSCVFRGVFLVQVSSGCDRPFQLEMAKRLSESSPEDIRRRVKGKTSVGDGVDGLPKHALALMRANSTGLERKQICDNILNPLLSIFERWEQSAPMAVGFSGIGPFSAEQYQKSMAADQSYVCTVHFRKIGLVGVQGWFFFWLDTGAHCDSVKLLNSPK